MHYITEDATKAISNLCKLDQQGKNRFQTKQRLQNSLFVKKLQGNLF